MDIIAGIAAATEALKIAKELRNIDTELDKADLKLRLVEIVDQLLAAKEALQDAKQDRRELLDKISELEDHLKLKARLEDEQGRLYELDENGNRFSEPYCNHCFVKEGKLYRLRYQPSDQYMLSHHICDSCSKTFGR